MKKVRNAYKTILCCLMTLTTAAAGSLYAQDNGQQVKSYLQQLQARYRTAGYLGFHIKYLYTNAGNTAEPIDSLAGDVQLSGSRCRLLIDSTETVVTDKYTIQVRPEEQMIVLSSANPYGAMNPVGIMDSLLDHIGQLQAHTVHGPGEEALTIDFPPGQAYRSVRIVSDARTGYLKRISYSLRTEGLVAQDMISRPGHPGPYQPEGRIDMLFSRYREGEFNDALFNEGNYFNKINGRYEAAGRYKDYRIFLASSNL